ncbi:MAG: ABC transporter ATP-binding protein [Xanthomonadales bacterium]|nr:ABC transporter ATP-binding protein [Xanthomonadales bacterium]
MVEKPGRNGWTPDSSTDAALKTMPWLDAGAPPMVSLRGLTRQFGAVVAVDAVDLEVYAGELFSILGGSGSGKTTLLRMLAGFEVPTRGTVLIDGVDMTRVPPYERPVNMMFQSYALFPHMTVEQNVAYGLKKEGLVAAEIRERVAAILEKVKMSALARRKPAALSGGESQRVALARALVKRPKLLLLDEPLAALDKKLREHTQFELMNLQDELGVTFIVVTHDQEEAMTLSTRIAVMNAGRLEQVGTPGEVYEYPRNRFVADFVGNVNLLEARVTAVSDDRVTLECPQLGGPVDALRAADLAPASGDRQWIAVRPEKILISKEAPADSRRTVLRGIVYDLGYFGNLSVYRVKLDTGHILQVSAQNRVRTARKTLEWDDEVFVSWDCASAILLNG